MYSCSRLAQSSCSTCETLGSPYECQFDANSRECVSNVSVSKKSLDYCRLYETGCDVIVDDAAAAPRCASCRDGYYEPENPTTTNPTTPAATTKTITTSQSNTTTQSTLAATTTKINTTTTTQTNTTTTTQSTLAAIINTTMTSRSTLAPTTTTNPPSTVKATTVPTFATTFAPVLINVTCFPCSEGCSACQSDVVCTECKNGYKVVGEKCNIISEKPATVSTTERATFSSSNFTTTIRSTVNGTSSSPKDDNLMLYIIIGASSGGGLILIILFIVCIVCCARSASNRRGKLVVSDDLTFVNVKDSVTRGDVQKESVSPMEMNPLREIKDPEAPPVPERPATRFPFPPSSRSPSCGSLTGDLTGNTFSVPTMKDPSKSALSPPVPPPRPSEDDEIYLEVDADSPNNDRKKTFIATRSKIAPKEEEEEAYYIDGNDYRQKTKEENEDDAYYIDTSDVVDKSRRNVERVPSDAYVAFTGKSEPLNSIGEDEDELYIGLDETPKKDVEEDDIYEAPDENSSAPPPAVAKKPLLRAPTPKKRIVSPVETKEEKTPNWKADVEKLKRQLVTGESEDRDDPEQLYQNIPARSMTESKVDPRRSGLHKNERGRLSSMPATLTGYEEGEELYENTDSALPVVGEEEEELYGNQDTIDGVSSPQLDDIYGNQDVIAGQEEQPIYGNA